MCIWKFESLEYKWNTISTENPAKKYGMQNHTFVTLLWRVGKLAYPDISYFQATRDLRANIKTLKIRIIK